MTLGVRRLIAAVIAAVAVWLLVFNVPAAASAFRARRAFESACDNFPMSAKAGTWVRLKGCGTNPFYSSFLTDSAGKRVRRLIPVWWIDAEARKAIQPSNRIRTIALTPSSIAVALPIPPDDDDNTGFRIDRRAGHYPDGLDPLVEAMGVVMTKTGTPSYRVTQVPGQESGLTDPAVVIDLRRPPELRSAAWRSVIGLAFLLFAWLLLSIREMPELPAFVRMPSMGRPRQSAWSYSSSPSRSASPSTEPSFSSSSSDVKWGRVLVFTLVGFVALVRGAQWYFDPARELGVLDGASVGPSAAVDDSSAGLAAAATAAAYAPSSKAGLPEPTSEELALLASVDPVNQMKAIELMNSRTVTPELVTAVDLALQNPLSPTHAERLVCLQTRFDTPDSLERLIARMPSERRKFGWGLSVDLACTVNALVRRGDEQPERIRDTLMPAALASNYTTRHAVLEWFKRRVWQDLPPALVAEASAPGTYRKSAVTAALALGAARLNPDLVAAAAKESDIVTTVSQELKTDTSDSAARLIARIWTEGSADRDFERLAIAREDRLHDVSSGLLEIVLDTSRAETHRQKAADRLGLLQEVGPITPLRALSAGLADGDFKASVDKTIAALDVHRAKGLIPRMRALF